MHVLDPGGPGGAARTLAQVRGCRVTVLDLTEDLFCRIGTGLTMRTGLNDRVRLCVADAVTWTRRLPQPSPK